MESSVRRKLNWFFSEFVVVVTGVLVALAINAAWQGIQDDKRGAKYSQRLIQDFETTVSVLRADSLEAGSYHTASARFIQAFRLAETPPEDSLRKWLLYSMNSTNSPVPVGTVEALVSSEDLQLIPREELRFQLPRYLDEARQYVTRMKEMEATMYNAGTSIGSQIDLLEIVLENLSPKELEAFSESNPLFVLPRNAVSNRRFESRGSLIDDREVYSEMTLVATIHQNMANHRNAMLTAAREVRRLAAR